MVWTYDADQRREDTKENATHKNGGKRSRGRSRNRRIDRIREEIEMREEN